MSYSELDQELLAANLIINTEEDEAWGWDCLSKIFHFGTKISKQDLAEINIENAFDFASEYIEFSETTVSTSPPIHIEKSG